MRLIDADALMDVMYHEAFETDSDRQKWDSGCWIRYKMFEEHIANAPTVNEWIPVSEGLPEEHEWVGTKTFGTTISDEVYVTFESPKGERFTKHLSFQNGKLSNFKQREIDAFHKGSVPIAWKPLPDPYREDG